MNGQFGPEYARLYDEVYVEKAYADECRLLTALFERHSTSPVRRVLDLGCGTGGHAIELACSGLDVVGVDRAAAMLARAREKARAAGVSVAWSQGDLRGLDLDQRFDAVVMMFAVLGYQLADRDVMSALATARRHLVPGGLLAFDVWHGPTVLAQRPAERRRPVRVDGCDLLRIAKGTLDEAAHRCRVVIQIHADGTPVIEERHDVRYFFEDEVVGFLGEAGFYPLEMAAFPNPERELGREGWSMLVIARADSAGT